MSFLMNHETLPAYRAGGLQLQVWDGDAAVEQSASPRKDLLNTTGETVRWTQQMRIDGGNLIFEITSGSSTTWGAFGDQGYLKSILPTNLTNLAYYHPSVSTENSGVDYASHRVTSFVLKEVRFYDANGLVTTDTTLRVLNN